jgi:hypothetical protein
MAKCITVKQPWASLIVHGIKDIENRTWKTNFRGRVLIHAGVTHSKREDRELLYFLNQWQRNEAYKKLELFYDKRMPYGTIIGSVEIVDCVINHPSIWAEKTEYKHGIAQHKPIWNWVLKNPILFDKPIPCKGALSFWEYNGELPNKY